MLPIGPLMREHRLIERMIRAVRIELGRISETARVNPFFIDFAVDFLRTYADRCHHGKEEDILFRDLAKKELSKEHSETMRELTEEHMYARKTVGDLIKSKESYVTGNVDSLKDVTGLLKQLVEFYPMHIEKEDKRFFYPCMEYFTEQEKKLMLQEFWEFDRNMIHEKYQKIVGEIEAARHEV